MSMCRTSVVPTLSAKVDLDWGGVSGELTATTGQPPKCDQISGNPPENNQPSLMRFCLIVHVKIAILPADIAGAS